MPGSTTRRTNSSNAAPRRSVARELLLGTAPRTEAAMRSVGQDTEQALRRGQYARALGAQARGLVAYPTALARDIIEPPAQAIFGGVPAFIGGLFGSDGSTEVRRTPAAQAPQRSNSQAAGAALAQGRETEVVTPRDRLAAFVDAAFQRPLTLEQAQAAAGVLPAPTTPRTAKDAAVGTASSIADAAYQLELTRARAMTDQAARDAAIQKATDNYFNRVAAISGANTSNLSLADFLPEE